MIDKWQLLTYIEEQIADLNLECRDASSLLWARYDGAIEALIKLRYAITKFEIKD